MIDKLIDIAFRVHIEPLTTVQHAAKVETVIKVLSNIIKSYDNYLAIEFLKNEDFKKAYKSNNKVLDSIKEQLDLLIVDLNFGSFEAALAPNLAEIQSPIFKNEVLDWKRETFENYKGLVVLGDFNDSTYLKNISKRYTDEERYRIYKPFFTSVGTGKDYKLNITNKEHKVIKSIKQPEKSKIDFYIPKIAKDKQEPEYNTAQVFVRIRKNGDKPSLTKRNVKEILYYEELEHETYPYKPDIIKFENKIFVLSDRLECEVEYEDNSYIIKNKELDIIVWGETREEVEEAFSFSFYSMYINYFLEKDDRLSEEAKELKNKLSSIIKNVINEAS